MFKLLNLMFLHYHHHIFSISMLPIFVFIILSCAAGEGAYARVFLATCLKTSRPVAIKVVDKEKLNPTQESCVRRELTNQSRLWHHNVVPLLVMLIYNAFVAASHRYHHIL